MLPVLAAFNFITYFIMSTYITPVGYAILAITSFMLVMEIKVFLELSRLMKKCHQYEYFRTRKSMRYQIYGAIAAYLLKIFCTGIQILYFYRYEDKSGPVLQLYCPQCAMMQAQDFDAWWFRISNFVCFIGTGCQLPNIILSFIIVKVKSSVDIL